VLTAFSLLLDAGQAVDTVLTALHAWGPPLAATTAALAALARPCPDSVRTPLRTPVRTASGRRPGHHLSPPLTCPDTRPDASADAHPDTSGHGSGGS
jgi:hypothetical protein